MATSQTAFLAMDLLVVLMLLHLWIPEDQERMIQKYRIKPEEICVAALQREIHDRAQCHAPWTKFQREIIEVP